MPCRKYPVFFIKCGCKITDILKVKNPHKTVFNIWRHKKKKGFSVIGHRDDHKDYSVIKKA